MSKAEEPKRHYPYSDPVSIQIGKTTRISFIADKAKFIEFDPDYADPFSDNWLQWITDAENSEPDSSVVSVQQGVTLSLEAVMEQCREKYKTTKHFVLKAFPNNKPVLNEFGDKEFNNVKEY